ncbi:tetratricopeptide repeat protein [Maridesulfovibrio hydrothermalis]|uniref:Tetratricopeptide TPR_2 repeat protein n=1 Tax=Maridesulfovibrio hydrothermalis AM13 = DSM 14728 TaxID=1121451 RepID=L0R754_9BACT|nr:hypothetical protein [Maridesulfovibrio hydrothermalis]CCO22569.1 Tetratricopeptide TPR_2 repeat protein [Maridesulfovibrio hydrothermalis AM13 = DSM 14728]
MRGKEKIRGIFSSRQSSVIGTGTTKKRTEQSTFWYAQEQDNGVLKVQPINNNYVPSGPIVAVEMEMFLRDYNPEPELYAEKVLPSMRQLNKTIELGESHRKKSENYSAEHEFKKAINIDELSVRANFGLGLTYLDRGEISRADDIFRRLVCINASYDPEHKHLFNEFGISLRKSGMHSQALEYYQKAEELVLEDENLCLNIARVHYEMGNLDTCIMYLKKALQFNHKLEEACVFLNFLHCKGFVKECAVSQLIDEAKKKTPTQIQF